MDTIGGGEVEPEACVEITRGIDIRRRMLACQESQVGWLVAIVDVSPDEMLAFVARRRGLVAGCAFAEGFAEVTTYPRTGSQALLPGLARALALATAPPPSRPLPPRLAPTPTLER